MMQERKVPSLVDLCVQTAVDNLSYLGDDGDTDLSFLERILPHSTVKQLMRIENSTEGRDLSPVTNKLWKNFYELKFGDKSTNRVTNKLWKNFYGLQFGAKSTKIVVEWMKQREFKWKQLYEAKSKDLKEAQQKSFDRIKELYKKEDARKQSRQVQLCTKVPPSRSKRSFYGGGGPGCNFSNTKSSLMKKTKLEFLNSKEVKNLAAMKKIALQRNHGISSVRKPGWFL